MDARTAGIAFVFAALAAGFVWLGFRGEQRYEAAQAEQAALAALPAGAESPESSPTATWPQGDLTRRDFLVLGALCLVAAGAAWLWLLFAAFSESLAWGFVVLLGNWLGAIAFCVFGSRRSMAPLFVMTGAYGLLYVVNGYWLRAAH